DRALFVGERAVLEDLLLRYPGRHLRLDVGDGEKIKRDSVALGLGAPHPPGLVDVLGLLEPAADAGNEARPPAFALQHLVLGPFADPLAGVAAGALDGAAKRLGLVCRRSHQLAEDFAD